jgi:adenine phosphoribosyltransferase
MMPATVKIIVDLQFILLNLAFMELESLIKAAIRDVPDFPQPGIIFKDITTLLQQPKLCSNMLDNLALQVAGLNIQAVAAIESRGFMFGFPLALRLGVPFVPIRKKGKLPYDCISHEYTLEYGTSTIEAHTDAIHPWTRVLLHDDLLATGGTAEAAAELIQKLGGQVAAFSFLIELSFSGRQKLEKYTNTILSLVHY